MKRFRIIVALMGALMFYPASSENTEARPQTIPIRVKSGNHGSRSVNPDINPSLTLWGNFHKFLVIFSS